MKKRVYIALFCLLPALPFLRVTAQTAPLDIACWGEEVVYSITGSPESTFDWSISPDSVSYRYINTRRDSIAITWNHKVGDYRIFAYEITKDRCYGPQKSATVTVSAPIIRLPDALALCIGTNISLSVASDYSYYVWNGDTTNSPNYSSTMLADGVLELVVGDGYGCESREVVVFTAYELPVANLGPDTSLCKDETLTLYGGSALRYEWSTDAPTESIQVSESKNGPVNYWVRLISEHGCTDADTITINVCDNREIKDLIPNYFTPNGDDDHPTWDLSLIVEKYPNMTAEVFDRWGILAYKCVGNCQKPWDGTSPAGRPLPMDSYYYIINLKDGSKPLTGNVTIIR